MTDSRSTFVLLPGLDGTGELFAPIRQHLQAHGTVVVVRYGPERTLEDYVATVIAALPARDAVLVAESFSGPIAMEVVSRQPERIRCVALCVTFLRSPLRVLARFARLLPARTFGLPWLQRALLRRFCFDPLCSAELLDYATGLIRSVPVQTLRSRLSLLAMWDMSAVAARISLPVLILRATFDHVVSDARYRQLIRAFPNSDVVEIAGPHLLLQMRPAECAAVLCAFAARTAAEA